MNALSTQLGQLWPRRGAQPAELRLDFDPIVRQLVFDNKARLFPANADTVDILDVALSPPEHYRWGCFHRKLRISYRTGVTTGLLKLWLKFGPELDELFPALAAYDERLPIPIFPRPYFCWRMPDGDLGLLATDHISGRLLRDLFLKAALLRRIGELEPIFRSSGRKMRAFHDAFPATRETPADKMVDDLVQLTACCSHLTRDERDAVAGHLHRCGRILGGLTLPAIHTHNDWVLRNIIVTPDGTDIVIDNQDLLCQLNWRWVDVVLFLLNLEAQLKWAPLATCRIMSRLWRAFWEGYVGTLGLPDGLQSEQMPAIFYLSRLLWLLDGVIRQPYFEIMNQRINRRFRPRLAASVARGEATLLAADL